ncbi:hypothetical protein ACFE04_003877 [Oxalis oulophora]
MAVTNLEAMKKMLQYFPFVFLSCFALIVLVRAQDQSGFISIDCGASSGYTDTVNGIDYTTDADYISTGTARNVSITYQVSGNAELLWNLRSFPNGTRNCYNVKLKKGYRYLIRALFLYGNYDGKSKTPKFDIHLGANYWGLGTPLISGLEIRLLKNTTYTTESGSLDLFARLDVASKTNKIIRFKDDVYDRTWSPFHFSESIELSTNQTIDYTSSTDFKPPGIVMQTAATPDNVNNSLQFTITVDDPSYKFYLYLHFAEVVVLNSNESRSFNISLNGEYLYGPVIPGYLSSTSLYTPTALSKASYNFSLDKTETSTLPPILNALEIYTVKELFQAETVQQDVDAVLNIKSSYNLSKDWQGDPCSPQEYVWDGLTCSYSDYDAPSIISLNLSSTGLTGEVSRFISNLTMLQVLDLSKNSLTGSIPDFLAQLSSLKVLNLNGNNFTGSVPEKLLERSKAGTLSLSVDDTCTMSNTCSKKKKSKSMLVPVVAAVASFIVLIIVGVAIFFILKKRKQQPVMTNLNLTSSAEKVIANKQSRHKTHPSLETKNRRFTYEDIIEISNNLETVIGEGGFGKVYLGYLDNNEVAVKILSVASRQGYTQFQAEVNLLMRVHHRHLTTLVGYCEEENKIGLIYEFMANGDLSNHLSQRSTNILSWEGRLKIAVEASQGLEYLHDGCKPPIVHRDVKTANILLNDKFQAKIADFGLSKSFPIEDGTHVTHLTTVVAGTPGYLDPEYYVTGRLTEKSDVFSFGVVLLEIITSRPVITNAEENGHISQWVNYMISSGDIKGIVDQRLRGDFDTNSAWKALEVAMACVSPSPTRRPTMNQVVMELKECLVMEMSLRKEINSNETSQGYSDMFTVSSVSLHSGMTPLAR